MSRHSTYRVAFKRLSGHHKTSSTKTTICRCYTNSGINNKWKTSDMTQKKTVATMHSISTLSTYLTSLTVSRHQSGNILEAHRTKIILVDPNMLQLLQPRDAVSSPWVCPANPIGHSFVVHCTSVRQHKCHAVCQWFSFVKHFQLSSKPKKSCTEVSGKRNRMHHCCANKTLKGNL